MRYQPWSEMQMHLAFTPSSLSRLALPRLRASLPVVAAALALSGCAAFGGGEQADITGDSVDEVNWSDQRTTELEAEVAALKAKNAELEKQIASLEGAEEESDEAAGDEALAQPPQAASAAPAVSAKTVVAAADVKAALADAPAKPVQSSPRLVSPTFASGGEKVFENEAQDTIKMSSVLYGVHLASYRAVDDAKAGWRKLQRENPDELGLLEPHVVSVTIEGRGDFIRLIGGGFASRKKAESLCATLKAKGVYCAVMDFGGERLSLTDASEGQ